MSELETLFEQTIQDFYKDIKSDKDKAVFIFSAGSDENSQAENRQRNKKFLKIFKQMAKRFPSVESMLHLQSTHAGTEEGDKATVKNDYFVLKDEPKNFVTLNRILKMCLNAFGANGYYVAVKGKSYKMDPYADSASLPSDALPFNPSSLANAFSKDSKKAIKLELITEDFLSEEENKSEPFSPSAKKHLDAAYDKVKKILASVKDDAPKTVICPRCKMVSEEGEIEEISDKTKTMLNYGFGSQNVVLKFKMKDKHEYRWTLSVRYDTERDLSYVMVVFPEQAPYNINKLFTTKLREVLTLLEFVYESRFVAKEANPVKMDNEIPHYSKIYAPQEW